MKSPSDRTILFLHSGQDWIRGSERVLLDLATHIPALHYRPVVWCDSEALATACRQAGLEVVEEALPVSGARPWWRAASDSVRTATQVVRRTGAGLLHVNGLECLPWSIGAGRAARVPVLVHLHLPTSLEERIWSGLHQSTVAVGVSEFSIAWAESDGLTRAEARLIYNSVFPERLERGVANELRAELGIAPGAFVAATVGSLIPRKDIATVIEAVAEARESGATIHLLILGSGEELERLEQLSRERGTSGQVHFLGDREDVGAILRDAADVLVSAAREETLGLNVIEAGYFGLPSVVTDIPPHREIVANARTGLLFRPGDSSDLASRLVALQRDSALRRELGARARDAVHARFLPDRFIAEFDALYAELLRTRPLPHWLRGFRLPRCYWGFVRRRLLSFENNSLTL